MNENVALPVQGRPEREHLYRWVVGEEDYVHNKFDNEGQRDRHDSTLQRHDIDEFWTRQVSQYYDRARVFLNEALMLRMSADDPKATESAIELEKMAQQAICKAFMTSKGMAESAVRVFGSLPKPGLSSGYVEPWEESNYDAQ